MKHVSFALVCCVLAAGSIGWAQGRGAQTTPQAPDIVGQWTGAWSAYSPAQGATPPREQCAKLDANVVMENGTWVATFEGDCGRPYKYTIKMEGRQVGGSVMFKGTVDLGQRDGGVYDWIGRATGNEFFGFYTNPFSTGTFNLSRVR